MKSILTKRFELDIRGRGVVSSGEFDQILDIISPGPGGESAPGFFHNLWAAAPRGKHRLRRDLVNAHGEQLDGVTSNTTILEMLRRIVAATYKENIELIGGSKSSELLTQYQALT